MVHLVGKDPSRCENCGLQVMPLYQRPDGTRFCPSCILIGEMMQVRVELQGIAHRLNHLLRLERIELEQEEKMSAELDVLAAQVHATVGVIPSAVALLNGMNQKLTDLAAQLAAQGIDNAAVLALSTELKDATDPLAAAVAANPTP